MSATAFYLIQYERQDGSYIMHAHHHTADITNYAMCGLLTTITTLQPVEQIPIEERVMEDLVQFYQDNEGISCSRIEESLGDILYEWLGRGSMYIYMCHTCLASIRKMVKERYRDLVSRGKVVPKNDLPASLTLATAYPEAPVLHITALRHFNDNHNAKWFRKNNNILERQAPLCSCSPRILPDTMVGYRQGVQFSTTDLSSWKRVDNPNTSAKCIDDLEAQIRNVAISKLETRHVCKNCLRSLACILRDHYPQTKKESPKIDQQEETKEVKVDTGPYTAVDVPRVGFLDPTTVFGVLVFSTQDEAKGLQFTKEDIIPYFLNRNPWQGGFITMGRTPEEAIQQLLDGKDSDEEREETMQALREGRVRIFELTSREYTFSIKETKRYTVEATRVFV